MTTKNAKRALIVLIFTSNFISVNSLLAQTGWAPLNSGTDRKLNAIARVPPANYNYPSPFVIALGDSGTVTRSEFKGETWTLAPVSLPGMNFESVSLAFPDTFYAAGPGGNLSKSTDQGLTWFALNSITAKNIHAVGFGFTTAIGYALGDSGLAMRTLNGGATWTLQNSGTTKALRSIAFVDFGNPPRIWACGDSGTILRKAGGSLWSKQTVPLAYQSTNFKSIYFDVDTGWAVGEHGAILTTRNGGTNWTIQTSGVTVTLRGVNFYDGRLGYAVGDSGAIVGTTDGGLHWTLQVSGTMRSINSVVAYDDERALAVGDSGLVLFTITGGSNLPRPEFFTKNIRFGRVALGSQKISTMAIHNDGVSALHVGSVSATPGEFAVSPGAGTVDPGETGFFDITFSPALIQEYSGSITFYHDGAESSTVVQVSGSGILPAGTTGWIHQNPNAISLGAMDVRFPDQSKALMCGYSGGISATTDGGILWSLQSNVGGTQMGLSSLFFLDGQTGYGVGGYGTIVKTTDSGLSWYPQESRTVDTLIGVAFATASRGVAIGYNPLTNREGRIIRTSDGGATWSFAAGIGDSIPTAVAFADSNNGFVAAGIYAGNQKLYRTTDGGATWIVQIPYPFSINSIDFNGRGIGIFAGLYGYPNRTTDGGETWTMIPGFSGGGIYKVRFFDSLRVAMTVQGGIYQSSDAGLSWIFQPIDPTVFFSSVDFSDQLTGIALGTKLYYEGQRVFTTSDGGVHWIDVSAPRRARNLRAVSSSSPGVYTAVGDSCLILKSTDDGATWSEQMNGKAGERIGFPLLGTASPSDSIGYVVGPEGVVLRTQDGGIHWVDKSLPIPIILRAIACVNESTCVAVGDGGIIARTTNSGASWSYSSPGPIDILTSISIHAPSHILVAGDQGAIMTSDDAGLHWTLRDPGITQTLMGAAIVDNASAVLVSWDGKIYRSADGGESWSEISYASTIYDRFNGVSFANSGAGTIVGTQGLILRSSDGGLSWTRQSSGTQRDLSAVVNHDDLIATAVGTGGTILHTTNGGGPGSLLGVDSKEFTQPSQFALLQNYPNPFNPSTVIRFQLPVAGNVKLTIYDILGREVAVLVDGQKVVGDHAVTWNAGNFPSGVYFYRLTTEKYSDVKKLLLLR